MAWQGLSCGLASESSFCGIYMLNKHIQHGDVSVTGGICVSWGFVPVSMNMDNAWNVSIFRALFFH